MSIRCIVFLATVTSLALPVVAYERMEHVPGTGESRWLWEDLNTIVTLTQRRVDLVQAFFIGRGLDSAAARRYAERCVFLLNVHNTAAPAEGEDISIDLSEWRVRLPGQEDRSPSLQEHWEQLWKVKGQRRTARVSFHWATYRTRRSTPPGSASGGMMAMGLAPGSRFDLKLVWLRGDLRQEHWLSNLECGS